MTFERINNILKSGEGTKTEFKEARSSIPASLYETVVSFSNTAGGTIILGVDDDGNVTGINPDKLKQFKTDISTALNDPHCVNPPLYLSILETDHPLGKLLIIQVPASSQVHNHSGSIFWRENDADIDITDDHQKVSDLYLQKKEYFSETRIYSALTEKNLDETLFDKARSIIRGFQPTHPWVRATNEQILKESSLYRVDYQTGEVGLTLKDASWEELLLFLVPSWNKKGTKLLHKKVRYLLSILFLSSELIKLEQMMNWIGYRNKKTFRANYIAPLIKIRFVQMTIPNTPRNPEQKYFITEKGKLFLAGKYI